MAAAIQEADVEQKTFDRGAARRTSGAAPSPGAGTGLLESARDLLDAGHSAKAAELLRNAPRTPEVKNLLALCALGRGQAETAIRLYREICLIPNTVLLRPEVPLEWKTNFATALLREGNVLGAASLLFELRNEEDDRVEWLRASLRRWESELTFWEWLNWRTGIQPTRPISLDVPAEPSVPGEVAS